MTSCYKIPNNVDNIKQVISILDPTLNAELLDIMYNFCYQQNLAFFSEIFALAEIIINSDYKISQVRELTEMLDQKIKPIIETASIKLMSSLTSINSNNNNDQILKKTEWTMKFVQFCLAKQEEKLLLELAHEFYEICHKMAGSCIGHYKGRIDNFDLKFIQNKCIEFYIKQTAMLVTLTMLFPTDILIFPTDNKASDVSFYKFISKICTPHGTDILLIDNLPKEIFIKKQNRKVNTQNNNTNSKNFSCSNDISSPDNFESPSESNSTSNSNNRLSFYQQSLEKTRAEREFFELPSNRPYRSKYLSADTIEIQLTASLGMLKCLPDAQPIEQEIYFRLLKKLSSYLNEFERILGKHADTSNTETPEMPFISKFFPQ